MLALYVTLQTLFTDRLDRVKRDDKGATMIEYGLMVVGIAVVVGIAAAALGTRVSTMFGNILK